MNLEEQIKLHKELSQKIEELEQQKKVLGSTILQQMQDKTLRVGGFLVRKYNRLSIKLTVEEARAFEATKMEEAVDKDKIKALYHKGNPIPGVTQIEYIQISLREEDKKLNCN